MNQKFTFSIVLRIVSGLLLLIIVIMCALWQPWDTSDTKRTISITGTGKISAAPDTYQFNPSFQKPTSAELNAQVKTVTDKLKELGVAEKDITLQTSASSGSKEMMVAPAPPQDSNYAYITIKVSNKELAQKVQDYISSTDAQGQLTPYPIFSDDKQKQLKDEARQKAIADAKSQAAKTASGVDAKVGKVIEIKDADGTFAIPMLESGSARDSASSSTSLPILAGEQEVSFSVQVVFELK